MLTIQRSPARVTWWIMYNGVQVAVEHTKRDAKALANKLAKEYGVHVSEK